MRLLIKSLCLYETQNEISFRRKADLIILVFIAGELKWNTFFLYLLTYYLCFYEIFVCPDVSFQVISFPSTVYIELSPETKFYFCQNDCNKITCTEFNFELFHVKEIEQRPICKYFIFLYRPGGMGRGAAALPQNFAKID